jgi:DNA helicase INO80
VRVAQIEIDVYCDLTARQKRMYRTLREHISITDLVSRASSLNDDDSVKRLMNLIMQFRKVCNHPELFERADVTAPLAFASFSRTANLIRDPEVLEVPYATQSVIEYRVPKKLYRYGGVLNVPGPDSGKSTDTLHLTNLMNIWTPEYIQRSMSANGESHPSSQERADADEAVLL